MALSTELLQAIVERRPLATLVTITPASGSVLLYSDRPFTSESVGKFEQRVRLSKLKRQLSGPDGGLDTPSLTLTVIDTGTEDVPVGAIGRAGRGLEDATVLVQWGAEDVAPVNWSTRYTGYVVTRRPGGTRGEYSIVSRVNDRWLEHPIGPRLTVDTWPTAQAQGDGASSGAQTVLGLRAPVAYGTCDSTGLGSHGLRPLLFVQTIGTPFRWLYSLGDVDVDVVYVDGKPVATGWAKVVDFRGGYYWTTIDFVEHPGEDDGNGGKKTPVITADGGGLDVGSFGADSSPAAQLRHALEAFGGTWDGKAAVTAQLTDDASWEALEDFCAANGYEGAGVLGGRAQSLTLRELLRDMLRAWGWTGYWTREGRLAVIPERWARDVLPPTPGASLWLVEGEGELLEPLAISDEEPEHRKPGLRLRYCPGPDGAPLLEVAALDPGKLEDEPEEISVPLGPQRVV